MFLAGLNETGLPGIFMALQALILRLLQRPLGSRHRNGVVGAVSPRNLRYLSGRANLKPSFKDPVCGSSDVRDMNLITDAL